MVLSFKMELGEAKEIVVMSQNDVNLAAYAVAKMMGKKVNYLFA